MADPAPLPRYLQLLWGREPAGRRGPKPGRDIEDIGRAAVDIADSHGLEGVSMKAVAESIGFTSMSLYRYLDSKEELYAVMLEVAYGPPDLSLVADGTWREQLERWARALVAALVEHPWISHVPLTSPPVTPHVLGWTDAGARALAGTSLSEQQKLSSLLVVDGYVRSHVRMSLSMGVVGLTEPAQSGVESYGATLRLLINPTQFPALLAATPELEGKEEDFFESELTFGLDLVLDGIQELIDRRS